LTSKLSRKVAATRFVTSIDMWDLGKFPFETLLKSFKSFIAECPASDLSKITSWRMPTKVEHYSTSVYAVAEPILGNLTSLHAIEPSDQAHIKGSELDLVLDKCTSLKQLYYRANSIDALDSFLGNQPKLQGLAVDVGYIRLIRRASALLWLPYSRSWSTDLRLYPFWNIRSRKHFIATLVGPEMRKE
jgi:hypothetical protein